MGKIYNFNFREQKVENEDLEIAEAELRGAIAIKWIIQNVRSGNICLPYELSQEFRLKEKALSGLVTSLNKRYRNEDKVQRACWNREAASKEFIMNKAIEDLATLINEARGDLPSKQDEQLAVQHFLSKIEKRNQH